MLYEEMQREMMGSQTQHLRIGDRVIMKDHEDDPHETPSLAIVYDVEDVDIRDVYVRGEPLHEYGVNPAYVEDPAEERLVRVMFTRWLDRHISRWQGYADDPKEFREFVDTQAQEWGIPLEPGIYDFPESRLKLRHRPDGKYE